MIPSGRVATLRGGSLAALLAFLAFSCGSSGNNFAGGGTGGTGISTGSIAAFGSVVVNGTHFRTDDDVAPGFRTKKMSNGTDQSDRAAKDVFAVGMVVTVRHVPGGNDAVEIDYGSNLLGPVAFRSPGPDNVVVVLGQSVVVENAAVFASLRQDDIVEVSGFADNAGRIRAVYVKPAAPPMPPPLREFETKGFVSGLSGNAFRLGPLPDGRGATVTVSYGSSAVSDLPAGPVEGMYVRVVTADRAPDNGVIDAVRITRLTARTEFPDNAPVRLEGLVTDPPSGSGKVLSFAVEGKRIRTDDATDFTGHSPDEIRSNTRLQIQGTETGGVLSAGRIVFPQ